MFEDFKVELIFQWAQIILVQYEGCLYSNVLCPTPRPFSFFIIKNILSFLCLLGASTYQYHNTGKMSTYYDLQDIDFAIEVRGLKELI